MTCWIVGGALMLTRPALSEPPRLIDGMLSVVVACLLYLLTQRRR